MALPPCEPCTCIDGNIPIDKFKQDVLVALCGILTNTAAVEAVFDDAAIAGTGGAVTTAGVSVYANTDELKAVSVGNKLDVPVLISFDGGANYSEFFAVNENRTINFNALGVYPNLAIFAKAVGSNSSSGTLYLGITK